MANGFQAVRVQGTSGTCGIIESFFLDGTTPPVAIGDVVFAAAGTTALSGDSGFSTVQVLAADSAIGAVHVGVVVGFEVDPSDLLRTGRLTTINGIARVAIDSNQVYAVEVAGGVITAVSIGKNASTEATTPATVSENLITSNMSITTVTTTGTLPWRIVGADSSTFDSSDNSFTRVYVKPNETFYRKGQTGV